MLGVGIILMGLMALLLINIISNYSSGGELDYYLLKETTEAALEDSLIYSNIVYSYHFFLMARTEPPW